ncbi:hypothetical protein MD484_g2319, partial [Candolleomyces efflorescens]
MAVSNTALFFYTGLILTIGFYRWQHRKKIRLPLPPGPKKLPLVGNLFQLPTTYEWEVFAQWSETYNSDILHVEAAGKSIIIVNSHQVATDLFDKRSALYSSRVTSVMINELIKFDWLFGFMPYGEPWKERRRLFQKHFHPLDTASHQPRELEHVHKLLKQLVRTPDDFIEHIRHAIGAITISIAYGLDIKPLNDPYIEIAEQALQGLAAGAAPTWLVDSLPVLKYVPPWFPGASFRRKAEEWRVWATKLVEVPFFDAQKAMAAGNASPSFVSACLNNLDETKDPEAQKRVIMDTAGNFFVGGADTSVSSINTFMLMMVCHPEIQEKAQQELERVLGKNVLPTFEDEPSLPYITAIVKEVLRYHAVTPFAIPHYLTENDEYNGYFLPKGSIVLGNVWVCPGKHMAYSMLYIAIASILSAFEIKKVVGEDGKEVEPKKEFVSSMVSHPKPFDCTLKPRSAELEKLILSL